MRTNRPLWWLLLAYLAGLLGLAGAFRHALNADAVAYLRLSSYYAHGQWALAISGYWSPLASWLMAPFLKLGLPPLAVGRGFMVFSALVFWSGCLSVFRTFQLSPKWFWTGAALAGAAGMYWSVQFITPDLLLSGLIGFAASRLLAPAPFQSESRALLTGCVWGLAYLAKAVAFPLTLLAVPAIAWLVHRQALPPLAVRWRCVGLVFVAFALVAGPWVVTLSVKYHKVTFSTTPAISHALTGPPDAARYHPFARILQPPERGRITSWEEPSGMAYNYWSPFESLGYAGHEVKVLLRNLSTCFALLTSLNVAWLLLLFAWPLERLRHTRTPGAPAPWTLPLLIPALLGLLYLPAYVTLTEQRFFYPAFAFLWAALARWGMRRGAPEGPQVSEPRAWWFATTGALVPLVAAVMVVGSLPKVAGDAAFDLSQRIAQAHLAGPVAGSAMLPGGRTGLYLAFLLNQPWYGDKPDGGPGDFAACGARLVVARRGSVLDAALGGDPGFKDLDGQLFPEAGMAEACPLRVYQNRQAQVAIR